MFHKTSGSSSSESPRERLRPSNNETSSPSSSTITTATSPMATPFASQATVATNTTSSTIINSSHRDEQQPQPQPNKMFQSVNKQQMAATALHQHYLNYFNSSIPKEDTKSHRTRGSISNSLSQHSQQQHPQLHHQQHAIIPNPEFQCPLNQSFSNQRITVTGNHLHHHNHNTTRNPIPSSSSNIYPITSTNHYANTNLSSNNHMSRSVPRDDAFMSQKFQQQQQLDPLSQRTFSTGAIATSHPPALLQQRHRDAKTAHNQDQLDRDSEETTTIKAELENDLECYKNSELEAISSLERNLPIELSFLIRQQAQCMAKMNYLDRQIRELRENAQITQQHQQQTDMNQVSSTSISNRGRTSRTLNNLATATMTHTKNGNFILSDDSGGEYSRATISDDDELSSLLDQIAKSVRPERSNTSNNDNMPINSDCQMQHLHQQQRLTTAYSAIMSNKPQQQQQLQPHHQPPYAIINSNQLHHHQQAVPIFVMGSPIAVAHPSSISSNILPGVHFQPEPRYNQYYEDFYGMNNATSSIMIAPSSAPAQRQSFNHSAYRSQQFDQSISAVEQLVSQKEKRQIISQLKSADNWLKMRTTTNHSSSLFNQQEASLKNINGKQPTINTSKGHGQADATSSDMKGVGTSTSTKKLDNDCVIMKDENGRSD